MALWRYVVELPDGTRRANVLRAGNRDGAEARARRHAATRGGRLVEGPAYVGPG